MPELRQFLRYFIPGTVFLLEMILVLLPVLNLRVFVKNPNLLQVVGLAVVFSPAIGYLNYIWYDKLFYARIGRGENAWLFKADKRPLIEKVKKELNQNKLDNRTFGLVNLVLYSKAISAGNRSQGLDMSELIEAIRGFWDNHNARFVLLMPVWLFAMISASLAGLYLHFVFFPVLLSNLWLSIAVGTILFILSYFSYDETKRIRSEIYGLEEAILENNPGVLDLIKKLTKPASQ